MIKERIWLKRFYSSLMKKPHHHPLWEWQHILGYCNWGLNAYPLLCPSLQSSYVKIHGKKLTFTSIHLNHSVIQDLTWFTVQITQNSGVYFLEAHSCGESKP